MRRSNWFETLVGKVVMECLHLHISTVLWVSMLKRSHWPRRRQKIGRNAYAVVGINYLGWWSKHFCCLQWNSNRWERQKLLFTTSYDFFTRDRKVKSSFNFLTPLRIICKYVGEKNEFRQKKHRSKRKQHKSKDHNIRCNRNVILFTVLKWKRNQREFIGECVAERKGKVNGDDKLIVHSIAKEIAFYT